MASKNSKIAGAGGAAVVVVIIIIALLRAGNADTTVVLGDVQSVCVVTAKADIEDGKKNKFVTWSIQNNCTNENEIVTVGNFRSTQNSSATDCLTATEGSAIWPFQEDPSDISKRQSRNQIKLKIKTHSDLPGDKLTYFFDVCTGASAERRSDPRLVIEP
jgi:hypothetical protein